MNTRAGTIEILLLEDNDLDAELLRRHLERARVDCHIDRVWEEADFRAALGAKSYGVILADYVLPGFDGMGALAIARELSPETPFIFVSGTLGEEVAIESLKHGATDYVVKHRQERLPSAIERALAERETRQARLRAEQSLVEINAALEAMVRSRTEERDLVWRLTHDLVAICDSEGYIRNSNPAWREMLGWSATELQDRRLASLVAPGSQDRATAARAVLHSQAYVQDVDLEMVGTDGRAGRMVSWTFVRTDDGRICGTGRDITQRLELEAQLRQAQKIESIGQLTGGVAHDFNNVLMIVQGNLQTLQRTLGADTPERERRWLDNALKGVERGARLTKGLLAYSRKQPLAPQAVDANETTTRLVSLLTQTLGAHVELHTELAEGLWPAYVDPNQLENALINLAINARDAMAPSGGGRLTISTSNRALDEAYCRLHPEKTPGDYVQVVVKDSGPGMPPDVLEKAFDPFFTTKKEGHGTGLGLSQVYGFVKQSGGHVKLVSQPGQGAAVHLLLPRDKRGADLHGVPAADFSGIDYRSPGGETVLVLEDDAEVRSISTEVLRELGYRVLEAGDGPAALRLVDEHPDIDLVFSDVGLPGGMNGREVAEKVHMTRPDLPVIFTSAYASQALVSDGALMSGVALLEKPFTTQQLAARVRRTLDRARG
ncbi:response regulator [Bordetella sp. LUAb4]|uniref:response regulator n=1 Tax=Bordetella sp. LUAb4 TaxID=2843195 RepID=UPI001E402404